MIDPFEAQRDADREGSAPAHNQLDAASGDSLSEPLHDPHAFFPPTPSARIPHIGHVLVFLSFAFLVLLLSQLLLLAPHAGHSLQESAQGIIQPKRQILAMAIAYLATLGFCALAFPLFWHRKFLAGVHWNGAQARRLAKRLIPLGLVLGLTVQAISSLIPMPKSIPMDDYFRSRSDVWLVTVFGITLAPFFEELCFRGFLLPPSPSRSIGSVRCCAISRPSPSHACGRRATPGTSASSPKPSPPASQTAPTT